MRHESSQFGAIAFVPSPCSPCLSTETPLIARLDAYLDELGRAVDELALKLSPVLRPAAPIAADCLVQPTTSPLRATADKLRDAICGLHRITERIDL